MLKKINILVTIFLIPSLFLCGCGKKKRSETAPTARLKIVASFFPLEQFALNVADGVPGVEIESLLPASHGCPHDYFLKPGDMRLLSDADVLIINGLGMEEFSLSDIKRANPDIVIIDASSGIKMTQAEALHESSEHHSEKAVESEHHHHHGGVNPHLFSSPYHAAMQVRKIAQVLAEIDADYADLYRRNGDKFAATLDSLAEEFKEAVANSSNRKIATIHEVFDYLAEYTGLEIVATIESQPGQEPSAGQMLDLVELLKRERPAGIFLEPQYPAEAALAVAKEADIPVYTLDPVANGPESAGKDYYLDKMLKNLETLRKALNH